MNSPKGVAERFYTAFAAKTSEQMCALYAEKAEFSDPVFPKLVGEDARNMWRMLCETGKDLKIEFEVLSSTENIAYVEWNAWYTFSKTKRKIHNKVYATLEVKDGLILKHTDKFSFWRWSRQALGPIGFVLGWSPMLQKKVQNTAAKSLALFSQKRLS